ncbi:MAG: VanZ family protein [Marinoscillum sp.]|jgi:VanZ family protein
MRISFFVWTLLMCWLLFKPGNRELNYYFFTYADKIAHFSLFFGWTFLLKSGWIQINVFFLLLLVVIFAGGSEIIQAFVPNRSSDLTDAAADVLGACSAILVLFLTKRNQ